jgi:Na+-transporting NADH:ubiquinone oxidoreductase subunit NqrB
MVKINRISFGGTAAIVTSMALITGLNAVKAGKTTIMAALLIAAIADNLTDSLSVHIYQESERLERREAFLGTMSNFVTRFTVCLSFVLIVMQWQGRAAAVAGIVWGMSLLAALTYVIARERKAAVLSEIAKHLVVASMVLFVSQAVGHWICKCVS